MYLFVCFCLRWSSGCAGLFLAAVLEVTLHVVRGLRCERLLRLLSTGPGLQAQQQRPRALQPRLSGGGSPGSGAQAHGAVAHEPAVAAPGLLEPGLSSCGARVQSLCGIWGLPGPGPNPRVLHWQKDSCPLEPLGKLPPLLS